MDWRICNHLTSFVLLKKLFVIHDLVLLCWLQMTKTVEDNSCWSIILWAFCMWMSFVFELLLFHVRNLEWVFFFWEWKSWIMDQLWWWFCRVVKKWLSLPKLYMFATWGMKFLKYTLYLSLTCSHTNDQKL
jgi:hypothetical protein